MHFPNYSAPPRMPYQQPISSHPIAAPCGPGRVLANGAFVSRGGVFEGPTMSRGDEMCGFWSDHIGDVNQWQQGYPPSRPAPPYVARQVKVWPPETRSRFQPRSIMLGIPPYAADMNGGRPRAAMSGCQRLDPMHMVINRSRQIWTGPLTGQADWPAGMTPRGGTLDGNTLSPGGHEVYSAFYDGASPPTMLPPERVNVMPNPAVRQPVPVVGWGVPGTPARLQTAGYGEYYSAPGAGGVRNLAASTPSQVRRDFGVQEATRPAPIMRGDQSDNRARVVGCGASPDGLGGVPLRSRVRARLRSLRRR